MCIPTEHDISVLKNHFGDCYSQQVKKVVYRYDKTNSLGTEYSHLYLYEDHKDHLHLFVCKTDKNEVPIGSPEERIQQIW